MITIFHGDDQVASRQKFLDILSKTPTGQSLHLDSKNLDPNQINSFLGGKSLFSESQTLAIDNFFSAPKAIVTKLIPVFAAAKTEILIWQNKTLNATQIKLFPNATTQIFKISNAMFKCLNSLKPHNLENFSSLFNQVVKSGLYDLYFYLLKASLRKQLVTKSIYPQNILVKTYLQLIDLEFQLKSGQLVVPREIAIQRVLLPLLK